MLGQMLRPAYWAFQFYFSQPALWGLSLPVAALRAWQGYTEPDSGWLLAAVELLVGAGRLLQFLLVLALGVGVPLAALQTRSAWESILQGLSRLRLADFLWELAGYGLVFGLLNLAIFLLLRGVAEPARLAWQLGLKNLFVIPVSVITLFRMLRLL